MTHEHAFRVVEATDYHVPTVETDHNIPVLIHWVDTARRAGPLPVYVLVSGLADGVLEFTIDPTSGELLRAIVLSFGAIAIEPPPRYPEIPVDEGCGLVIDRSLWAHSRENVISLECLTAQTSSSAVHDRSRREAAYRPGSVYKGALTESHGGSVSRF